MEDNQYTTIVENTNEATPDTPPKKSKLKLIIAVVIIAIVVIGGIILAVLALNKSSDNKNEDNSAVLEKNNDTLQIYAELDEEIALESIDSTIKNINAGASVSLDDGYGTIKMSDSKGEFISFYFETEAEEKDGDVDEQNVDDEATIEDETHGLNIAYGFTYVLPIDEENSMTISCEKICYYYDGSEIHEFDNKKEAIDAYLKTSLDN